MKRSYAYEHVTSRSSSERATHMIPGLVSRSGARVGDGGDVRDGARYLSPQNARGESRREPLCDATRGRDDGGAAHVHRAVRDAEKRLESLTKERDAIAARLADPALYDGPAEAVTELNRKQADLARAIGAAEEEWLAAQETLEAAEAGIT